MPTKSQESTREFRKACIDCKYVVRSYETARCAHPQLAEFDRVYGMTSKACRDVLVLCDSMDLWEAKSAYRVGQGFDFPEKNRT